MVRPVTSKRKLFNISKDQFKENEPDQINVSEGESYSSKTISPGLHPNHKAFGVTKKGLPEGSSCEARKEREAGLGIDWHRKCGLEDGGNQTPVRNTMPMSERQQIALLLQLSSPSPTAKSECNSPLPSPQTPTTPHFGRGLTKRNERGETPLHVAAIKGDREKVSQLIAQGANVNATDYAGWTALHEACNRGFLLIASLLIRGGADVNAKGLDNDTPLHDACVNNHFQIVRLLLRSGARTDAANCRGKTPLDVCRSPRILSLLEEAKSGKFEDKESPEKEYFKFTGQEAAIPFIELGHCVANHNNNNNNNNNKEPEDYTSLISKTSGMSRKTPPTSKMEEKPTISPSTSSSSVTSTSTTSSTLTTSGNGTPSGGNGRPVSPRVTLRLPHVPRTPEKSQQRSHDNKSNPDGEDIYEFRCSKEESKEGSNEEKGDGAAKGPVEGSPTDAKGDKRPRENDPEDDEEMKKKRRKEEGKEILKGSGRGAGGRPSSTDKTLKVGQRTTPGNGSNGNTSKPLSSTAVTASSTSSSTTTPPSTAVTSTSSSSAVSLTTTSEQRKSSPPGSAVNSPRPPSGGSKASAEKSDSDGEEVKSESNTGAPKVPPLKIVLAPCSLSEQETSSINGKNGTNRQLPYVVNSSASGGGGGDEKENATMDTTKETPTVKEELCTPVSSSCSNSPTITTVGTMSSTMTVANIVSCITSPPTMSITNVSNSIMAGSNISVDKASATRITRSQRGGGGSSSNEEQPPVKTEVKSEDSMSTDVVHPRKRKIKMKEPETEQIPPSSIPEQPVTNCYEMFLKIRKQVERRRKLLFPVQPKPPQGFKDYLMNRCSYVLANSSSSQLSVPVIPPPASLAQPLKDLFNEQEQERYKLRLQQLIEKEKLVLSVEQEILRVHGRAARALANQVLPFSVCTILKDEEVYNVISAEQEEKDRNARSRYNGRLFLSWLQDVDDKWEKIKEAMVLRHHNEAESLHAVQKMDWEWKLKELGLVEPNTKVQIDELNVPMVQVADFDLLPA